jgi:hypothetical protein
MFYYQLQSEGILYYGVGSHIHVEFQSLPLAVIFKLYKASMEITEPRRDSTDTFIFQNVSTSFMASAFSC